MDRMSAYARKLIAGLFGISEKRVKQLTEDGIIEEYSEGYYKLVPTVKGYIKYLKSQIADDDKTSDYNVEKARLTKAKREKAELELQAERNELHKASDIEFVMGNLLVAFREKLVTLPYKVLPDIMDIPEGLDKERVIIKALNQCITEALEELSEYSPDFFNDKKYLLELDDTIAE